MGCDRVRLGQRVGGQNVRRGREVGGYGGTWLELRVEGKKGGTEATEARLGTCQRGQGSYNSVRAIRPVNVPLLMTLIRFLFKYL